MPKLDNGGFDTKFGYQIDKKNDNVGFEDKTHTYFDLNDGSKYISTTQLIHRYVPEFDSEFWSSYKACEYLLGNDFYNLKQILLNTKKWKDSYLEEYNINKTDFLNKKSEILNTYKEKSKEACEYGNKVHGIMENLFYQKDQKRLKTFGLGGKIEVSKGNYKLDKEKAVYPEILLSYKADEWLKTVGQADLVIKDGNDISIYDWKGLPLTTKILTTEGWTTMGELKVGDKVFDNEGNPTSVVVKSRIHYNPCYKIIFDNDEIIIADKDHKWIVGSEISKDLVKTTEELYKWILVVRNKDKYKNIYNSNIYNIIYNNYNIYNNIYIYNTKPLNLQKQNLSNKPYKVGKLFGNNIKTNNKSDLYANIPNEYLFANYEQRLDLLKGLMDTIGYYDLDSNTFKLDVINKSQIRDITVLLATLGIKTNIIKITKKYNDKLFSSKEISFKTNKFNPFLLKDFKIGLNSNEETDFRIIKNIIPVDTVPTQCIEVDSPTHTFLCTERLLPTHNTSKSIDKESFYNKNTNKRETLKFPLNNIQNSNYWIYSLQLSLYMYMIEKINPKFKCKKLAIIHIDRNGNETEYPCEYLKEDVARMLLHYRREQKIKSELDLDKQIIF